MSKDFNISMLLDFYGEMLTEKQREALDFYYNKDLSLLEISGCMDISRQGARDFIKRGEKQLIKMEKVLGLAKRFGRLTGHAAEIDRIAESIGALSESAQIDAELEKLKAVSLKIKESL